MEIVNSIVAGAIFLFILAMFVPWGKINSLLSGMQQRTGKAKRVALAEDTPPKE